MISAIPFGGSRPSIPEFPQTAHYIEEALNAVYYGTKDPKEALDKCTAKICDYTGMEIIVSILCFSRSSHT